MKIECRSRIHTTAVLFCSVVVHTPLEDAYLENFEILFALLEAPYLELGREANATDILTSKCDLHSKQ